MTPEEKFQEIMQVLDDEIHFYMESNPPLKYRFLCWLCRIRPRHEAIVDELGFIYRQIFRIWVRDGE